MSERYYDVGVTVRKVVVALLPGLVFGVVMGMWESLVGLPMPETPEALKAALPAIGAALLTGAVKGVLNYLKHGHKPAPPIW